jgi:hypothetical protein
MVAGLADAEATADPEISPANFPSPHGEGT